MLWGWQTDVNKPVDIPLKSTAEANISHDAGAACRLNYTVFLHMTLSRIKQVSFAQPHQTPVQGNTATQFGASPEWVCDWEMVHLNTDNTRLFFHVAEADICNVSEMFTIPPQKDKIQLCPTFTGQPGPCQQKLWSHWTVRLLITWIMLCTCTTVLLFISRIHSTHTHSHSRT